MMRAKDEDKRDEWVAALRVAVQLSLTPRIFCAVLVAGITLGTPVFAQRYVEVGRSFAVALIRDVLIAIN